MIQNFDIIKIDENNEFIKIKSELRNNNTSETYLEFLKKLKPNYFYTYLNILIPVILLIMICYGHNSLIFFNTQNLFFNIAIFFSLSFFFGMCFHVLQQAFHVGIHFELHSNRDINDKISNLIGLFTASEIKEARKIHMLHHRINGTPDDPENSYFKTLNFMTLIKFFSGIAIITYALGLLEKKQEKNIDDIKEIRLIDKIKSFLTFHRIKVIIFHSTIIICNLLYFDNYILAFSWFYGFIAFYPFFSSLLNILEHGHPKEVMNNKDFKISPLNRLFDSSFISKYIYGSFGANKHAIHHWDPTVHHSNMDDVEKFLYNSQIQKDIIQRRISFFKTLKQLI